MVTRAINLDKTVLGCHSARLLWASFWLQEGSYVNLYSKKTLHFAEGFKDSESIDWIGFVLVWGRNGIIDTIYIHISISFLHMKIWHQNNVSTCINTDIIQIHIVSSDKKLCFGKEQKCKLWGSMHAISHLKNPLFPTT